MTRRVLYGVANYEEIVRKNGYFVDKTPYIARLEAVENPVFLRPRRFGKSLLCRMLECYYNVGQRDQFEELFGHTWIGQHPTPLRNTCIRTSKPAATGAVNSAGSRDLRYGFVAGFRQ